MRHITPRQYESISEAKESLSEVEFEDDIRGYIRTLAFAYINPGMQEPIIEYIGGIQIESTADNIVSTGYVKSVRSAVQIALERPLGGSASVYLSHLTTSAWQPMLPTITALQSPHTVRDDHNVLSESESLMLRYSNKRKVEFAILSDDYECEASKPHSMARSLLALPDSPEYLDSDPVNMPS